MGRCSAIDTAYRLTVILVCATGVVAVNHLAGGPDILWITELHCCGTEVDALTLPGKGS